MATKELVFDIGLVSFSLNGKCEITFNPTDTAFVERLYSAFYALDKKQEAYKAEIEQATGKKEIFDVARKLDAEMRDIVDDALGAGVCEAVFGGVNVYALADGLPIWANLLLAIMDEIDTSFAREKKQSNTRIAKYTSKYHR